MTLLETLVPQAPPLRMDEHGVLRVAGTRIPLERVLFLYARGETPADIHEAFPTLEMADIHAAISYYLRNRSVVDDYLRTAREEEERIRVAIEKDYPSAELRARIRSRRDAR